MLIWNPWREIKILRAHLRNMQETEAFWVGHVTRQNINLMSLNVALELIAAQEKPTSNATVRRMARMAREALKT